MKMHFRKFGIFLLDAKETGLDREVVWSAKSHLHLKYDKNSELNGTFSKVS